MVVSVIVGTTEALSDDVRAGLAFPFLLAGLIVSLSDIQATKDPIRWPQVATVLLTLAGTQILGYHAIANAKAHAGLLALLLVTVVATLFAMVPLIAHSFEKR